MAEAPETIRVTSTAFNEGQMIPKLFTCDGDDISPPLDWTAPPDGVKSYVIIGFDPDAHGKTFIHWIVYSIPENVTQLGENVPKELKLPNGARQGKNSSDTIGYTGPCPPSGTHRYYFRVYALDTDIKLNPGATNPEIKEAMQNHIIAEGELMGRYGR